jgi:hypothetical protein
MIEKSELKRSARLSKLQELTIMKTNKLIYIIKFNYYKINN